MPSELNAFMQDLFQDIISKSEASGSYSADVFFEHVCEILIEAGEINHAERASCLMPQQDIRVDGYGSELGPDASSLVLIVSDFHQVEEEKPTELTTSEMNAIFGQLTGFLGKSLDAEWRNALEDTSPVFGLADTIAYRWKKVAKVRLILITNRILDNRVDGQEAEPIDNRTIVHSVWDIKRLFNFVKDARGKDDIEIDLENEYGGAIPILRAHSTDDGLKSYLTTIPGDILAEIYDKWGARLLEQNVRVFLQTRGKVNRGIRDTIEHDPSKFFAYNNGLTATAEQILTVKEGNSIALQKMRNFQIVNGGQTTASIHSAYRSGMDVSKIAVQMKLTTITPENIEEIVPKISQFANTQNRINAADFFSNHPFHVRIEEFSRRIFAPSSEGMFRRSKWFYERARGQYADMRASQSGSDRKKFDVEFPRAQLFSKTDLAKYVNVWDLHPHIVSLGAQKNFLEFSEKISAIWDSHPNSINEFWYKEAIAKAIIFKAMEKIVSKQPWYEGGYRANIVAYAIAKLAHDVGARNCAVDFEAIWEKQGLGDGMVSALEVASSEVNSVITEPPSEHRNVTEWAKKQMCWDITSKLEIEWPESLSDELISREEQLALRREGKKDQKQLDGIQAQTIVVNAEKNVWQQVLEWGTKHRLLTEKKKGILRVAAQWRERPPSELQSIAILAILNKLREEGYRGPPD